jgi:hypothetical protein
LPRLIKLREAELYVGSSNVFSMGWQYKKKKANKFAQYQQSTKGKQDCHSPKGKINPSFQQTWI